MITSIAAQTGAASAEAEPANCAGAIDPQTFTDPGHNPGVLHHIVLFRFKDQAAQQEYTRRFVELQDKCRRKDGTKYIVSIQTGTQNSCEKHSRGYQQGFLVTFRSEGDRNYYVGTPLVTDPSYYDLVHDQYKTDVVPHLEPTPAPSPEANDGALVFDFKVAEHAPA
jgi:stress responsive alpha/beta barrel protein